jgi:hypothetical protein
MTRQEKIDKLETESIKAWSAYQEAIAHATDDPEPQADGVETIQDALDFALELQHLVLNTHISMGALADKIESYIQKHITLTRLSAPVDVQTRAEAVARDFIENNAQMLTEYETCELVRLIVEQFSRMG